jgi:hypothetical protein
MIPEVLTQFYLEIDGSIPSVTALLFAVVPATMACYTYVNRPAEVEPKPVGVQVVSMAKPVSNTIRVVRPVVRQVAVAQPVRKPSVPIEGARGLTRAARNLADYISINYPAVRVIGGVRPDPLPDHPSGKAIDIMVDKNTALGNKILADLKAQRKQFGIRYMLWQTPKHYDHIHVTVY